MTIQESIDLALRQRSIHEAQQQSLKQLPVTGGFTCNSCQEKMLVTDGEAMCGNESCLLVGLVRRGADVRNYRTTAGERRKQIEVQAWKGQNPKSAEEVIMIRKQSAEEAKL